MPPVPRPYPRFIADSSQEGKPYGRWEERLRDEFAKACSPHAAQAGAPPAPETLQRVSARAGAPLDPETLKWFPERAWGGRVYVPVTGRGSEAAAGESEGDDSDEEP